MIFSEGEGEDADVEIGEWCIVNGQLVKYAEIDVDALEEPEILTPHKITIIIPYKEQAALIRRTAV